MVDDMDKLDGLKRLKSLFIELFQLDVADLDFGLYRLFRLKRTEIEAFLDKQLPEDVKSAFTSVADADRVSLQKETEDLANRARDTIADDAILASGEPNPAHAETKAVRQYAEARKRLEAVESSDAQRAEVFNLLYAFFSRYYDGGDFIPRRFFGARTAYAVPYNGEEVLFHWANKDQYYVKSGEAFRDYAFTVPTLHGEYRVRFRLVEATAPKDNIKGDFRYFFPKPDDMAFDDKACSLIIPFEYRLPTDGEVARYGKNTKGQEAILEDATPKILKAVKDDILGSALSAPFLTGREADAEKPPTLLRRRLTHFTKKNTTDYFVHKNLGAFLRQELEFFIRDQVVHELDLEGDFEVKRRMLRVFRRLADTVITFLAQIEDAQKRLFEKKKFVVRTNYILPIQNVPRNLWPEVLANRAQLVEWKELFDLAPKSGIFNLKGKINEYVLEQNPTLVIDTRHFSSDFTSRLLESIEDIDDQTDGVLIHGENYQTLNLIRARYREQVKCIYIDPPYNTDASAIMYKNNYKDSSWLALLEDRLYIAKGVLEKTGIICVAIDDEEAAELRLLLSSIFTKEVGIVAVRSNPAGRKTKGQFAPAHEYAMFYGKSEESVPMSLDITEKRLSRYPHKDEKGNFAWANFIRSGSNDRRQDRPKLFYPIFVGKRGSIRVPRMEWDNGSNSYVVLDRPHDDEEIVYPVVKRENDTIEKNWQRGRERVQNELDEYRIRRSHTGEISIDFKTRMDEDSLPITWWDDREYASANYGAAELKNLFVEKLFDFSKARRLVSDCIIASGGRQEISITLDFFAGSGTTGHAVINLNREDGGRRKFILVEVADYFDTVLVPRMKKVMFSPEWKNGKPKRLASKEEAERTPRLVKIMRLESYEDALHNTFSDNAIERLKERDKAYRQAVGEDEYRIRYMVKLPLEASDSMLNLAKLEHPFDYTLEILSDYGPKTETVDLVETFNWIYGLRVQRMLTWTNPKDNAGKDRGGRIYRAVTSTDREAKKRVFVVWRDMTGLDPVADREFLESKTRELGPFEEQWVNGDSAARGFASLDGLFKRLMAGGEV